MRTINTTPKHKFAYTQTPNSLTFTMLDGDRYLHTPFMCKDYLQDVFWSTHLQKPTGDIYGLEWKPTYLTPQARFELALASKEMSDDKAATIQGFLNQFDAALGIEPTIVQPTTDAKLVVVNFAAAWTVSGPMVSAFTSLIRLSGGWDGSGAKDYLKALIARGPMTGMRRDNSRFVMVHNQLWTPDPTWMTPDIERIRTLAPRLCALLAGQRPSGSWSSATGIHTVHDTGVLGFAEFPTVVIT